MINGIKHVRQPDEPCQVDHRVEIGTTAPLDNSIAKVRPGRPGRWLRVALGQDAQVGWAVVLVVPSRDRDGSPWTGGAACRLAGPGASTRTCAAAC
jgi:hypothetical protein